MLFIKHQNHKNSHQRELLLFNFGLIFKSYFFRFLSKVYVEVSEHDFAENKFPLFSRLRYYLVTVE